MNVLIAIVLLVVLALVVAWMAKTHDLIWKWIKSLFNIILNPVKKLLLIVVRKIKWVIEFKFAPLLPPPLITKVPALGVFVDASNLYITWPLTFKRLDSFKNSAILCNGKFLVPEEESVPINKSVFETSVSTL